MAHILEATSDISIILMILTWLNCIVAENSADSSLDLFQVELRRSKHLFMYELPSF